MIIPKIWKCYFRSAVINFDLEFFWFDNLKPKSGHNLNICRQNLFGSVYLDNCGWGVDLDKIVLSCKWVCHLLTFFKSGVKFCLDLCTRRINLVSIITFQAWNVDIFLAIKDVDQREFMTQILFSYLKEYWQRSLLDLFCCINDDLALFFSFWDRLWRALDTHLEYSTLL